MILPVGKLDRWITIQELIKGVGAEALQGPIIALSLFGILIMGAAVSRFRKRLD